MHLARWKNYIARTIHGLSANGAWTFLVHFPQATRQRKFLVVVVDYFIKWIEVKPLAKIIA